MEKGKDLKGPREQIVAQNRSASYNYHILEKLEAGLVLHGTEVKALREGKANIRDAYVDFKPSGAYLVMPISPSTCPAGRGTMSRLVTENFFFTSARFTNFRAARNPKD